MLSPSDDEFFRQNELFQKEFGNIELSSFLFAKDKNDSENVDATSTEIIKLLKDRLVRRTTIIDEIRKAYLRDVISIKHVIRDVLNENEREEVFKQYESNLPSLDLKEGIQLHAPFKVELQLKICNECGGHLELINRDTDEVEALKVIFLFVFTEIINCELIFFNDSFIIFYLFIFTFYYSNTK
jgi:hypothetical protein